MAGFTGGLACAVVAIGLAALLTVPLSGSVRASSAASVATVGPGPAPTSSSRPPTVGFPQARFAATSAYDAKDGYMIMFGGTNSTSTFADTWKLMGTNWTKLSLSIHPRARAYAAMTYDASLGGVLLFGGCSNDNCTGILDDTWEFAGGTWKELSPVASPPARAGAALTYDSRDGYALLFGGANSKGALFGDTWEFSDGNWTKLSPSRSPTARIFPAMAYDATDKYVVLTGGCGTVPCGSFSDILNDTWKFVSGSWTKLKPAEMLPKWMDSSLAYDAKDGYLLLFGGCSTAGCPSNDTWEFSRGDWTELRPLSVPVAEDLGTLTYDPKLASVVLFGGASPTGASNEFASYASGNWTLYFRAPIDSALYFGFATARTVGSNYLYILLVEAYADGIDFKDTAFYVVTSSDGLVVPTNLTIVGFSGNTLAVWNFTTGEWVSGNLATAFSSTQSLQVLSPTSIGSDQLVAAGRLPFYGTTSSNLS